MQLAQRIRRSVHIRGIWGTLHAALQGQATCYFPIATVLRGKRGLEIGGPSRVFSTILPLYKDIGALDNCDYSERTLWGEKSSEFHFGKRTGKNFFREGSDLSGLGDYDFILSCHNLEHMANPVKALYEWKRTAPYLVLVLPNYRHTFDHNREVTPVAHMMEDFRRDVGEADQTHMGEFIAKLDLGMAPEYPNREALAANVRDNFRTRCMHHHVFDENNSRELLEAVGYKVVSVEPAEPHHLILFAADNATSLAV